MFHEARETAAEDGRVDIEPGASDATAPARSKARFERPVFLRPRGPSTNRFFKVSHQRGNIGPIGGMEDSGAGGDGILREWIAKDECFVVAVAHDGRRRADIGESQFVD